MLSAQADNKQKIMDAFQAAMEDLAVQVEENLSRQHEESVLQTQFTLPGTQALCTVALKHHQRHHPDIFVHHIDVRVPDKWGSVTANGGWFTGTQKQFLTHVKLYNKEHYFRYITELYQSAQDNRS